MEPGWREPLYLGFGLGPDGHTLHYLTGGPIYVEGKRVTGKGKTAMGEAKGLEDLHLITYDTRTGTYRDNGAIFLEDGQRPTYGNSMAIGKDGSVYTLGRVKRGNKIVGDLIKIPGPFARR